MKDKTACMTKNSAQACANSTNLRRSIVLSHARFMRELDDKCLEFRLYLTYNETVEVGQW